MKASEYQNLAMRTNNNNATEQLRNLIAPDIDRAIDEGLRSDERIGQILNASLGLSGEVGEFNDMLKKWIFHEKPLDEEHLKKELGDICWYIAMMADSFGWNLDDILQMNVDKLKARYPEGFDTARANNRSEGDV